MYARVLSQWALDLLELRRQGLDQPTARTGDDDFVTPLLGPSLASHGWDTARAPGELLAWRPARRAA